MSGYRQNPYFEGVISAITTQGEVTANVKGDRWEAEQRKKNATSSRNATSYPGGDVFDNLHVYPHELVFGWCDGQSRFNFPGEPCESGFSSVNGIYYGKYDTDEELMDNIYFIGLAKTPFIFDSLDQMKQGFSAIRVGSGTTFHTGSRPFFAGDVIEWSVVPRPNAINPNFAGGEFGGNSDPRFRSDTNSGGRQGYPRQGTPRGKFRFLVNPVVRGQMRPGVNGILSMMLKDNQNGGVIDMPVETLYQRKRTRNGKKFTAFQCYAKSTQVTDIIGACRIIEILFEKRILLHRDNIVAGESARSKVLDIVRKIGIFDTNLTRPNSLMKKILETLYVDFSALGDTTASGDLYTNFPAAYAANGRDLQESKTDEARYVAISLNYANIRQGSYDKAVAHKARRHCGIALAPSESGQKLDALFGHFLNAGNFSQ